MPRPRFNSPQLIRLLAGQGGDDAAGSTPAPPSIAERLGRWLDLNDAIALSGTLSGTFAGAGTDMPDGPARAVQADFARVRAALAEAITVDAIASAVRPRAPSAGAAPEPAATDFMPYRRYHAARQRDMEAAVGALRARLRDALAGRSPALRQLAALDAALGDALGERERALLAGVPQRLERRLAALYAAHQPAPAADDPAPRTAPEGWREAFHREMQAVLLAELEVRLQPAAGLVEALAGESGGGPATAFPRREAHENQR